MAKHTKPDDPALKAFTDSHPLSILVGVILSTATIVAGVMAYFASQRIDAEDIRHKAEIAELSTKAKVDLADAINPLKQTIQDLNFRLSSIERRVSGAGPSYLDVSTITIGPEAVRALGPKYQPFAGGTLYVAVPPSSDWRFKEKSQLEVVTQMFGLSEESLGPLRGILAHNIVYTWQKNSALRFKVKSGNTLTFTPSITVQRISLKYYQEQLKVVANLFTDNDEFRKQSNIKRKADAVANDIESLRQEGKTYAAAKADPRPDLPGSDDSSIATSDNTLENVTVKRKIIEKLDDLVSTDVATFTLYDYLVSTMTQSMQMEGHFRMFSTQKKGNVFYIQSQVEFPDAAVYNGDVPSSTNSKVVVDEEVFFIGSGPEGFLIKIYLPSVPDRSDAYSWTKNWLAGLQIALD